MVRKVCGVGINDSEERTQIFSSRAGGIPSKRLWVCPYYAKWKDMLNRCYSKKRLISFPTYINCEVDSTWLYFSNFRSWCQLQDKGVGCITSLHLDKDLLGEGGKYNEEFCVLLHHKVNTFIKDNKGSRGEWPLGVSPSKNGKSFEAWCRTPFVRKNEYIGVFTCPNEAHQAWQAQKHIYACQLADSEYVTDGRVAKALRERYAVGTVHL